VDERKTDVVVLQSNNSPDSVLHSAKSFSELNLSEALMKGISDMKWTEPSKIQAAALPIILSNPPVNVIAQSQSGTGKTGTFTLGYLSRIDVSRVSPQVLVLSPIRELVQHLVNTGTKLGAHMGVKFALAVREEPGASRDSGPIQTHVIIGTPGTVKGWIQKRRFNIQEIRVLVLDEAEVMLSSQGFADDTQRLNRMLQPTCQRLLFSATYEPHVLAAGKKMLGESKVISLRREELVLDNISVRVSTACKRTQNSHVADRLQMSSAEAKKTVSTFCGRSTIQRHWARQSCFARYERPSTHMHRVAQTCRALAQSVNSVEKVANVMRADGLAVGCIHGRMSVEQRTKVFKDFHDSKTRVLVTTNLLSRGINVETISLVVNFDLPTAMDAPNRADASTYVHRIGRCGRFGKMGVALNFLCDPSSQLLIKQIESYLKHNAVSFPGKSHDDVNKLLEWVLKHLES
jgi:ATP-dependent RNA helicase DDX19/DBP5